MEVFIFFLRSLFYDKDSDCSFDAMAKVTRDLEVVRSIHQAVLLQKYFDSKTVP